MKEYSVVGKRLPRVDAEVKVTGDAKYTFDVVVPRMLYGAILRSPYSHARILSIDTDKAEGLPGVKAVMTGKEIVDKWDIQLGLEPVLAVDYVRFLGQGVAAVAAIDPYVRYGVRFHPDAGVINRFTFARLFPIHPLPAGTGGKGKAALSG